MMQKKRVMSTRVGSATLFIGAIVTLAASAAAQTPSLSLSSASGAPGAQVTLSVSLNSVGSTLPAAIQWDLNYSPSDLSLMTGTYYGTGVAGSGAGKFADCNSISAGDVRCIVSGINTYTFGSGVVATLTFQIAAGTTDTSTPVSLVSPAASDANANALSISASGGTVTITQAVTPVLSSLGCSPASVTPPATSTCTVSLSSVATGTTTINLSSSAPAATVPASVNITTGLSSKTFTVSTSTVSVSTPAVITAMLGSSTKNFSLTLTPAAAASAVSVTPSSGTGTSHSFALQYSDTAGASNLQSAWAWFATTFGNPASSCLLSYQPATNQVILDNDAGTGSMSATVGAATTLQNSQCSLNMASTTVVLSGNTLTLNLALTFQSGYAGAKSVYLYAADLSGTGSGWQPLGTWTVPSSGGPGVASAVSVTPSSGSGTSHNFALQYSDTAGASNLQSAWAWFATTFGNPASSCLLSYQSATNQIMLDNDAGTGSLSATVGAATTLQNSQCSLNMASTTVVRSGNTLTLNLAMTFQSGYTGAKSVYLYAADLFGNRQRLAATGHLDGFLVGPRRSVGGFRNTQFGIGDQP